MVQVFLHIKPTSTNVVDPETAEAAAVEGGVEEENKAEVKNAKLFIGAGTGTITKKTKKKKKGVRFNEIISFDDETQEFRL